MTEGLKVGLNGAQIPFICIRYDWNDVLHSPNQEIWVSSKLKGQQTVHAKFVTSSSGKIISQSDTGDFSVLSLGRNCIDIKFNPTGHICTFLAPSKIFSELHKKKIVSLNVSSDTGLGVSVCDEDKLKVWKASTGECVIELKGHMGSIYKCRLFPSGLVVLSAGADATLKIWSAETGDCPVTLLGHQGPVNDLCIIDRGRNIISVSKDGTAKLWDCGKSTCLSTIFHTDQRLICCALGVIPPHLNLERDDPINEREVGTKDKLLVVGSEEGQIYGIGVFTRKQLFSLNADSAVNVVLILTDKIVVGCQSGLIEIHDVWNNKGNKRVIDESNSPVLCGCTYKDRGFFVGRNDGTVSYVDCLNFSNTRILLTGPNIDPVLDMSLTNDGKLYTCCRDGQIRQYLISESMIIYYK